MRKYFLYIFLSLLMLSSLLIVSCDDNEIETIETNYADPAIPKYGGIHNRIRLTNWNTWDYAAQSNMSIISMMGEELLGGDWARGPAGTNENDWTSGFGGFTDILTGRIAKNWEMPDSETIIYHIRQGIHWWNKEPANGRELTAKDVVWNIERHFSSPNSLNYAKYTASEKAPLSVTALDNYTVEVKVLPQWQGEMATAIGDHMWLLCPDAVESNDGKPLTEWQQFIGTGPFMIVKYVANSHIEYIKNPDYWQMDPLHPENQLPYAEGIKEFIIPVAHTVQAASMIKATFETGKADVISTTAMKFLGWEELDLMKEDHPELEMKTFPGSTTLMIWPRLDSKKALPFNDIRVRYAMNMAINQQELVDDYYGGHAELLAWPYVDLPVFDRIYTPLEEQSQIVQKLFGYNVEEAQELMDEAGYPDGFEFTLYSYDADFLSIIKDYLTAINIDMKLSYLNDWTEGAFEQAYYGTDNLLKPQEMMCMIEGSSNNYSRVSDLRIQEAYNQVTKLIGTDDAGAARVLKEIGTYQLEQSVPIYLPSVHSFVLWWPWLQNYYGAIGGGGNDNIDEYLMYFWLDTDMKAAMGN